MTHTPEFYESQIRRLTEDRDSWRDLANYQIGTAGHNQAVELLRADRDRWIGVAERLAEHDCPNAWQEALKIYFEAQKDTHEKVMKSV